MRRVLNMLLAAMLLPALVACGGTGASESEAVAVEAIPAGTLMMWMDFSWFAYVPAAEATIGHDELETSDHAPAYRLELSGFWIQQSEVTNRQYLGCVSAGACTPPAVFEDHPYWFGMADRADHPVVGVSWEQASAYCRWIHARLPYEAEWELAARGTRAATYPWGEEPVDCNRANHLGCKDPAEPDAKSTHPSGKSIYNVLDLAGNVREWVQDWHAPDWYPGTVGGPDTGTRRVVRGGGFLTAATGLLTWLRDSLEPDRFAPDLGFRCVLNDRAPTLAPYCQVPPLVGEPVPPLLVPTSPQIEVNGYCAAGVTGVVVQVSGGQPSDYVVFGPKGLLSCQYAEDHLACWGAGLNQDATVVIQVCPDCPTGFYYDWQEEACRPLVDVGKQPVPLKCPPGEIYIPKIGCVQAGPLEIGCPGGFKYTSGCGCIPEDSECAVVMETEEGTAVMDTEEGVAVMEAEEGVAVMETEEGTAVMETEEGTAVAEVEEGSQEMEAVVCQPSPLATCTGQTILTEVMPGCWACMPWDPGEGQGGSKFVPPWVLAFPELEPGDIVALKTPEMTSPLVCDPNTQPPLCWLFEFPYQDQKYCWHCKPWFNFGDECPQGSHYDAAAGCCVPDKPLPQACPQGYVYDALLKVCVPVPPPQKCQAFKVYIPACTSPQPACANPAQYGTEAACVQAGCRWVQTLSGVSLCTYP